jgi:hypothetical protein
MKIRAPNLEKYLFGSLSSTLLERSVEQCRSEPPAARLEIDREICDLALPSREPRDNITEHRQRGRAIFVAIANTREIHPRMGKHVPKGALRPRIRKGSVLDCGDR